MTARTTLAAVLAVFVSACEIDQNPSRTPDDPEPAEEMDFNRIENQTDAKLDLVHDGELSFPNRPWSLDCQETSPDKIRIQSDGETLSIKGNDGETGADCELRIRAEPLYEIIVKGHGDVDVDGLITGLERVEVRGNGQINFQGIKSDELTLAAHGDGEFRVNDLSVRALDLTVTGRGDSVLSGQADEGNLRVMGIGDLLATQLEFTNLFIEVSGAGNASVFVTDTIGGSVSGDGNLDVWGNPEGEVEELGSGHVYFHDGEPPAEE
jgi:hypothetical protein